MANHRNKKRRRVIITAAISIALLLTLAFYAPWQEVWHALNNLSIAALLLMFFLSIAYYVLKAFRFWILMKTIGADAGMGIVCFSYMAAQPVSLLPGGELYRSKTLEKYAGIPWKKTLSQFTAQGTLEGLAMALTLLLIAYTQSQFTYIALGVSLLILVIITGLKRGWIMKLHGLINRIPFVGVSRDSLEHFTRTNQQMFAFKTLPVLLFLSIVIEFTGGMIAYEAVHSLGGDITVLSAMAAYIVPTIIGFFSFLPGGFGAAEQSTVGILLLSGVSLAIAVTAALLIRTFIVILGVVYGSIFIVIGKTLDLEKK